MSAAVTTVPLLELRDVSKSFGQVHSLRSVSLGIRPGEVLGLLGDNGAGKSTLIKMLAGVYRPTSGSLAWEGADLTRLASRGHWPRYLGGVPGSRHHSDAEHLP